MDRNNLLSHYSVTKQMNSDTATWNPETQGNRRGTFFDEAGRKVPKWAYTKGRNEFRCKIGFAKDDFEEIVT